MKKRFSFNRLLHKDKLMMIVSLILAIVIWVLVDFDQEFTFEEEIHNVPVQVKLSEYAVNQGLKVVAGSNVTATVKVKGTRSELKNLKASDIIVTADAQSYLHDGEYRVPLTAVSKKCDIIDITGSEIQGTRLQNKSIWIECMRYSEQDFVLTALDEKQIRLSGLQYGEDVKVISVMLDDESVKDGKIRVHGPTKLVTTVDTVSVDFTGVTVSQTDRFMVNLKAYDVKGQPIDDLVFTAPESGEVGVVVRTVVYRNEEFAITEIAHAPAGFDPSMLQLSPSTLELGEISGEKSVLDSYVKNIQEALAIDFDTWMADDKMTKIVPLEAVEGIYLDRIETPYLTISMDVEGYGKSQKTFDLILGENVSILCDEGMEAELLQKELQNVVVCGPKNLLKKISAEDIHIEIDARGQGIDQSHVAEVRLNITLPQENSGDLVWVYYGTDVLEVEYAIRVVETAVEESSFVE